MGLSCGSKLVKCILFVFNVVLWFAGACMLGVGIWFLVDDNATSYLDVASTDSDKDSVTGAAVVLVIVGLVIFITGGFGCLGAIKESTCMLTMYAFLLILLLILQVVAGIIAVVFRNEITDQLEESLNSTMADKYDVEGNEGITDSWNFVQVELKCCGSTGPSSWKDTAWAQLKPNQTVPDSCCVLLNDDYKDPEPKDFAKCQEEAKGSEAKGFLHHEGCHEALEDWVEDHAGILIGLAFGLLAIQIIGIVLACCLKKSLVNEYQSV